jgi:tetratricopeptide (TPR) repeat protein
MLAAIGRGVAGGAGISCITRAEILEKLGQREKAIADYRAALKLNPANDDSKAGLKRLGAAP